jgi:hypothetical protein
LGILNQSFEEWVKFVNAEARLKECQEHQRKLESMKALKHMREDLKVKESMNHVAPNGY